MKMSSGLILFLATSLAAAGQMNVQLLPKEVRTARTVAIVNNTHNDAVEQGALEALKRWGKFTVVDDSDTADITLTFDKKAEHEGTSSQKPDKDGNASTSYSMSFSSMVYMRAMLKGATTSFYKASTSESKKKAGAECVTDLQQRVVSGP